MRFLKVFVFMIGVLFSIQSYSQSITGYTGGSDLVQAGMDYSQSQRYSYGGLTDAEKAFLKGKGYSDEQIERFSSEFGKDYVENGTDMADWSEEDLNMMSDLVNHDLHNSISEGRKKQIQQDADDANWQDIADIASNPLKKPWEMIKSWLVGDQKSSFPAILNAFTSGTVDNGCWFCPVFETLFETMNGLAGKLNEGLRDVIVGYGWSSTYSLMGLLLFGYIIFVVGKAFFSFKETEPIELFSQVFFPTMRCMIAALLIWNWQAIYGYMVEPLLMGSIGFGQNVMTAGVNSSGYTATYDLNSGAYFSSKCRTSITLDFAFFNNLGVGLTGGPTAHLNFRRGGYSTGQFYERSTNYTLNGQRVPFGNGMNGAIQCFLDTVSQNLITWMAVGASFIADCWKIALDNFFGAIQMLIIGIIIFVGAFMIFLSFPLKLIDSLFRLMFVTALMPLWVAFWVIPQTRGYTKKAWDMFVQVMFSFIILSVVLVMVLTIIEKMFDKDVSGIDIQNIVQSLLRDKSVKGLEYINFSGVGIFMTAALMYLAFSLVGKAESFVDHFASGGAGSGIGSSAASRMVGLGQKAAGVGVAAGQAGWRILTKKRGGGSGSAASSGSPSSSSSAPASSARTFNENNGPRNGERVENVMPGERLPSGSRTPATPTQSQSTQNNSQSSADNYFFADPDAEGAEASASAPTQNQSEQTSTQNNSQSSADNRSFADPDSEGADS